MLADKYIFFAVKNCIFMIQCKMSNYNNYKFTCLKHINI